MTSSSTDRKPPWSGGETLARFLQLQTRAARQRSWPEGQGRATALPHYTSIVRRRPRPDSVLSNPTIRQTAAGAVGQQLDLAGEQLMQRNIRIQPTLQVRPGYRFNVTVTKDLIVQSWQR